MILSKCLSKITSNSIIFIVVSIYIISHQTYTVNCNNKCGFKSVDPKKMKFINSTKTKSNEKNRKLSTRNMQIDYDTSELNSYNGSITPSNLTTIIENNLKEVINYIKELLSMTDEIDEYKKISSYFNDYCGVSHYNKKYSSKSSFDLLIFPVFNEDLDDSTLASASSCISRNDDSRPIVGIINFKPEYNISTANFEKYFQTIILHELTHVLGFNSYFFKLKEYIIQKEVNGVNRSILAGPKLLSAAKHHFNCDNIDGIELENSGGTGTAGSHWESRIMYGDYMTYFDFQQNIHQDH